MWRTHLRPFRKLICVGGWAWGWVVFESLETVCKRVLARASNAKQDLLLISLMWLISAWIPQVIVAHLPNLGIETAVSVAAVLFSIIFLYGRALMWVRDDWKVPRPSDPAKRPALDHLCTWNPRRPRNADTPVGRLCGDHPWQ
jgi:hypothetical protein